MENIKKGDRVVYNLREEERPMLNVQFKNGLNQLPAEVIGVTEKGTVNLRVNGPGKTQWDVFNASKGTEAGTFQEKPSEENLKQWEALSKEEAESNTDNAGDSKTGTENKISTDDKVTGDDNNNSDAADGANKPDDKNNGKDNTSAAGDSDNKTDADANINPNADAATKP